MTIEEVLKMAVDVLLSVNVPVALKEQIADPVSKVAHDLKLCLDAIAEDRRTKVPEPVLEDGPEHDVNVEEM